MKPSFFEALIWGGDEPPMNAAGGVTLHPAVPAVRAGLGDAAGASQRCPSCGDAVKVIGPGDEECRNPKCCWFRFPAAGSWDDEQWVEW